MKFLDELIDIIDMSISDEADKGITEWNIIKSWYNKKLDSLRLEVESLHDWLDKYQKELTTLSGISNIKIKFTSNSWYFIEILRSNSVKVPDSFIFLQTLTGSNRYTTSELKNFEENISNTHEGISELEKSIFIEIRSNVSLHFSYIGDLSHNISYIDFCSNGAYISLNQSYETPCVGDKYTVKIEWGKHPIISKNERNFIDNDLLLNKKDFVHVVTWPNMWWKSTYLRQNALLVLMSHMWYDIPCKKAEIAFVDRVFSRVWSWDNIYMWQSTFMVEMQEISFILRHASPKSFLIIDEIWRGTSTYDGMSLAWWILEYILQKIGSKTLFSTHYHEIIEYTEKVIWASNHSMAVWGKGESIVFLKKIISWWTKKSYWIEVAKLAGIPSEIIQSAKYLIQDLQSGNNVQQLSLHNISISKTNNKYSPLQEENCQHIIDRIKKLDINSISPLEWLQKLSQIQEELKELE